MGPSDKARGCGAGSWASSPCSAGLPVPSSTPSPAICPPLRQGLLSPAAFPCSPQGVTEMWFHPEECGLTAACVKLKSNPRAVGANARRQDVLGRPAGPSRRREASFPTSPPL